MYTVAELIETLKQCPQDYEVIVGAESTIFYIYSVGIDHDEKTVDLYAN